MLLLRRFRLPSGRPWPSQSSMRKVGVLNKRGYAVACAVADLSRTRASVSTNVMVRDLDIALGHSDSRRLEVIVESLSLFGGVQLALDATWCLRIMETERSVEESRHLQWSGSEARWQAKFRAVSRTAQGTVCAENPPGKRPCCALQRVEQFVVLFGSESVRNFAAGTTRSPRSRRTFPFCARGAW